MCILKSLSREFLIFILFSSQAVFHSIILHDRVKKLRAPLQVKQSF